MEEAMVRVFRKQVHILRLQKTREFLVNSGGEVEDREESVSPHT